MQPTRLHSVPRVRHLAASGGCKYLASCPYYRRRCDCKRPESASALISYCLDHEGWRRCLRFRLQEKYGALDEPTVGPA